MKYHITTFGCQMNVHESEKLAGIMEKLGIVSCTKLEDADIIVFNTCAIREGAQNRAVGNIGSLKSLKKHYPQKIIAVCGCMPQQEQIAKKLYKMFPFVDIIFGTKNFDKFESYLTEIIKNKNINSKKRIISISQEDNVVENLPIFRSSGKNFWVNIIYGCNNFCSYCIVPYVRGRERSRNKEDIINEIKQILNSTNEKVRITLLGQNVNSYGKDKYEDYGFAELLNEICEIDGNFELTFMTSHPKDITDKVIDAISHQNKIIKELHLPVQSGSDKILKAMNRKYTIKSYMEIINKLKKLIPNIRLTTDIIVGFPGETDEDFKKTCELIQNVNYSGIFAFMFSPREGTVAEKMENQVPYEIKNQRVNHLLNLEKEIQNNNSKK